VVEAAFYREDFQPDRVPRLCIRCGAPATILRRHTFFPTHRSAGLVDRLFTKLLGRGMTLQVPLCRRHRLLWFWPAVQVAAPVVCVLCFGGMILGTSLLPSRGPNLPPPIPGLWEATVGLTCVSLLAALVWVLLLIVSPLRRTIRATEIEGERIVLAGVAEAFVDAVERLPTPLPPAGPVSGPPATSGEAAPAAAAPRHIALGWQGLITLEELQHAYGFALHQQVRELRERSGRVFLGPRPVGVFLLLLGAFGVWRGASWLAAVPLCLALYFLFPWQWYTLRVRLPRQYEKNKGSFDVRYRIDERGVTVTDAAATKERPWRDYYSFAEDERVFLLYFDPSPTGGEGKRKLRFFQIVPKRLLTEEQARELSAFLRWKLSARRGEELARAFTAAAEAPAEGLRAPSPVAPQAQTPDAHFKEGSRPERPGGGPARPGAAEQ
jgi:hypothetical protein